MEFLQPLRDFIKNLDEREYLLYGGGFLAGLALILLLLAYIHYSAVNKYHTQLKKIEMLRTQTKNILSDYKIVQAQREKVDEILEQNKDFRIGEAFQSIIQKVGLSPKVSEITTPTTGESISGKTEVQVSAHFTGLNMKQVTDLLSEIAAVPRLFTKDLVIKKNPQAPAVDVDITVATLESAE